MAYIMQAVKIASRKSSSSCPLLLVLFIQHVCCRTPMLLDCWNCDKYFDDADFMRVSSRWPRVWCRGGGCWRGWTEGCIWSCKSRLQDGVSHKTVPYSVTHCCSAGRLVITPLTPLIHCMYIGNSLCSMEFITGRSSVDMLYCSFFAVVNAAAAPSV